MPEIIAALITAAATIIASIIQYRATMRVVSTRSERRDFSQSGAAIPATPDEFPLARGHKEPPTVARTVGLPNYFYWYLTGGLLTTVVTVFGAVNPDTAAIFNVLILIPFFSLLLAAVVPIKPAYSALVVTVATGGSYLGYAISGEFYLAFASGDFGFVLLVYTANAVLVLGIDFFRYRQKLRLLVD